jgi:hypothetical protein
MKRLILSSVASAALLTACQAPPQADPEFSDAARFAFREFDTDEPARLAFAVRALEEQLYLSLDLEAESASDRWMEPEFLSDEDVEGIDHPDYPVDAGLPVAVGKFSAFEVPAHPPYLSMADQTPVEPGGPLYDRTFQDSADTCWPSNGCEWMRTDNHLIKQNFLLTVEYDLFKDYRWIDLNLPDPSTVPEGQPVVNEGEPRWAIAARSWTDQVWVGDNGANEIQLSFSFEVWIPRDGGGYVRSADDVNQNEGTWTTDSSGGGSLRLLSLWSRTNLSDSTDDAIVQNTIRGGVEDIFEAQEEWLLAQ